MLEVRAVGVTAATATLFLVGACAPSPRVDSTSAESCTSSMAAVSKQAMASADSQAYAAALMGLMAPLTMRTIGSAFSNAFSFSADPSRQSVELPPPDTTDITRALCEGLDGYSARDIVAKSDSLGARVSAALDRQIAGTHLRLLRDAKTEFERAGDSLAMFTVESARLSQESGFMGLEASIALTVRNGTPHSISRAYFSARAISEGRQVPWLEETFNYAIAGGLEPGETARWRLQPNQFQGDWSKVRVPASAKFIVEVVKLDGPDGVALWGGASFSRGDQRVLDSLTRIVK